MENPNLKKYVELLLEWNCKLNLIGKSTVDEVWERHIRDSLQLLKFFTKEELENSNFADFGSGAGLPGLVLSIAGVKHISLLEKSVRKCEFLRVASSYSSNEIKVLNENIFELKNLKFDIVVARALAPLDRLLTMVSPFLKRDSRCLFLKGQRLEQELVEAKKKYCFEHKLYPSETSSEGAIIEIRGLSGI